MVLVGFERLGVEDTPDATWIIPSALTSDELKQTHATVERFERTPWVNEDGGDAPEDLLRRVKNVARDEEDDVPRDAFIDDSEGDDGLEHFMFPDNIRSKSSASNALEELKKRRQKRRKEGNREPLEDDVVEARRKAREAAARERRLKMKSELYIHSDDETDEEENKKFFAKEEQVRKRQDERVRRAMTSGVAEHEEKARKRKSTGQHDWSEKRRKQSDSDEDEMTSEDDVGMSDAETASSPQKADTSEEVMEDTPLSSQSHDSAMASGEDKAGLREMRQPPAGTTVVSKVSEESDEEDVGPRTSTARRRYRAGFIVDSDDE